MVLGSFFFKFSIELTRNLFNKGRLRSSCNVDICGDFLIQVVINLGRSVTSLQETSFYSYFKSRYRKNKLQYLYDVGLICIRPGSPWLSIREAVFTVSPKRQYLGILTPTTPATTGPLWIPTRI